MNDFELTFYPASFLGGIDKITSGWNKLRETFKNFSSQAKKTTWDTEETFKKGEKKKQEEGRKGAEGMGAGLDQIMGKVKALAAAYLGFRAVMKYLPEVGQTFQIAGDIMMRNFLNPLRRELMPYLQKVLDWVRNHRAMFVRWGSVLADVFRMVVGVIKIMIQNIQVMFNSFKKVWTGFFGESKKSLLEWIQVFMFKITTIMIAVQTLLTPVFEILGKLFGYVAIAAKGFFDGLISGAAGAGEILQDFIVMIKEIASLFDGLGMESGELYTIFKMLGDVVMTSLVIPIKMAISFVRMLVELVKVFMDQLRAISRVLTGDFKGALSSLKSMGSHLSGAGGHLKSMIMTPKNEIEKSAGRIKGYADGPRATASVRNIQTNNNQKFESNLKIEKVEVGIKDPEDAEKAGKEFGEGASKNLEAWMRKSINRDKVAMGVTP